MTDFKMYELKIDSKYRDIELSSLYDGLEEVPKASSVETQTVGLYKPISYIIYQKNEHRYCFKKTNSKCLLFLGQISISMSVLCISSYMLIIADGDCDISTPYIGIISFVLGKILSYNILWY